jgi:hypothetical protein
VVVGEEVNVGLLVGEMIGVDVGIGVSVEDPDGATLAVTSPMGWVAEGFSFPDWSGLGVFDGRGVQLEVGFKACVAVQNGMTGSLVQVGRAGGVLVRVLVARR